MDNLSRYIFHSGIVHAVTVLQMVLVQQKRYFTVHSLHIQYVPVLTALCNQQKEALILVVGTQRGCGNNCFDLSSFSVIF
jgi:hypothetical protein